MYRKQPKPSSIVMSNPISCSILLSIQFSAIALPLVSVFMNSVELRQLQTEEQNQFLEKIFLIKEELPSECLTQHRRLDEYKEDFSHAINYFNQPKRVAFIGDIGKGKTTAICKSFGLYRDSETAKPDLLLSSSSGRTTICEVEIVFDQQHTAIEIEAHDDTEVLELLSDYSKSLFEKAKPKGDEEAVVQSINSSFSLSVEIERALKNMLKLTGAIKNESGRRIQKDVVFAKDFSREVDLYNEFIERIMLQERTQVQLLPSSSDDEFEWVQSTFKNLNVGKIDSVGLPKKITVYISKGLSLNYNVVDTKGLDGTVKRADISRCIENHATLSIICSSFNDAPNQSMRSIIEAMIETGQSDKIYDETILLVLDQATEAENVLDEDGEPVDCKIEGRDIRNDHILNDLEQKYGLDADRISVVFYDSYTDNPEALHDAIKRKLESLDAKYSDRIQQIQNGVSDLVEELNSKSFDEAKEQLLNIFKAWFKDAENFTSSVSPIFPYLKTEINGAKSVQYIRASVNRDGRYYNLNMYEILGHHAKAEINRNKKSLYKDFDALIKSCMANPELKPVHNVVKQMSQIANRTRDFELAYVGELASEHYNEHLRGATSMWSNAASQWGKGSGYKGRVINIIADWFNKQHHGVFETKLKKASDKRWSKFLSSLKGIL